MLGGFAIRSFDGDGLRYRLVVPLRNVVPHETEDALTNASKRMLARFDSSPETAAE